MHKIRDVCRLHSELRVSVEKKCLGFYGFANMFKRFLSIFKKKKKITSNLHILSIQEPHIQ